VKTELSTEEIEALCKLEGIHIENGAPDAKGTVDHTWKQVTPDGKVWLWKWNARSGWDIVGQGRADVNKSYNIQIQTAWKDYNERIKRGKV